MKKLWTEKTFCYCFNVLSTVMFAVLFYYCLGMTGENSGELWDEHIYFKRDSVLINSLLFSLAVLLFVRLGKISEKWFKSEKQRNILLGTVCILSAVFSLYWIIACNTEPIADQAIICRYASDFNNGDFRGLQAGEYIARYPQQLGMVTLLRWIFAIFGDNNYQVFRYLVAALVPLLVLSGCKIVRILTNNNIRAELYYLWFILCCFPMYAYVNFVYSDLIASVFGLFGIWMYLSCRKKFSWVRLGLFGTAMGLMVVLRKNFLILIIALSVVMLVKLLFERKKENLLLIVGMAAGIAVMNVALWWGYHDTRTKDAHAIPASLFVVMGLNDDYQYSGWYNGYGYEAFDQVNDDVAMANEKAREDLKAYLGVFRNNPDYMIDFFIRKINAQWNAPMYQSIVMNDTVAGAQLPPADNIYEEGIFARLLEFGMKIYQLLMYGSILFLLIFRKKEWVSIEKYVLLIAVFGGFLFSIIWEAKTRYVLPYLFMQIPYMAIGLNEISVFLEEKRKKMQKK